MAFLGVSGVGKKEIANAVQAASICGMGQEPRLLRYMIFPVILATAVAVAIAVFAPQLGPFAYMSAWFGIFITLSIWGIITRNRG